MDADHVFITAVQYLAEIFREDFQESFERGFPGPHRQSFECALAPRRAREPALCELFARAPEVPAVGPLLDGQVIQELGELDDGHVPEAFRDGTLKGTEVASRENAEHRRRRIDRAPARGLPEMRREPPGRFLRLHECRVAADAVVVSPSALHRFAAPELQPDAFCESLLRKPVQELVLRLPVQLRARRLAHRLAQVGPRDEQLFDNLGEPVAGFLVRAAALERVFPQLVQV